MWIPKILNIKNFASHKDTQYEYLVGQPRLIQGVNLQDSGQNNNGSGKSIPIECLRLIYLGDLFRKDTRVVDLISDGEDEAIIYHSIQNSKLDLLLEITKKFYRNKSPKIELMLNGEVEVYSESGEYTKRIFDLLDFTKEDLLNFFFLGTNEDFKSFFSQGDIYKKRTLSRFSGVAILSGIEKVPVEECNEIQEKINKLKEELIKYNSQLELHDKRLEEYKSFDDKEFIKAKTQELSSLKAKIFEFCNLKESQIDGEKRKIFEHEKMIEGCESEIKIIEKRIKEIDICYDSIKMDEEFSKKEKLAKILSVIEIEKEQIRSKIDELNKGISEVKKEIAEVIICPNCQFEFSFDQDKVDRKLLKQKLGELEEQKKTYNNSLEVSKEDELSTNALLDIVKKKIKDKEQRKADFTLDRDAEKKILIKEEANKKYYKSKIKEFEKDIDQIKQEISEKKEELNKIDKEIEDLNSSSHKRFIEIEEKEIKICKGAILDLEKNIDILLKEYTNHNQWIAYWQNFQNWLINKSLSSVEGYTNYYLEKMESDIRIKFNSTKVLADGKTERDEIGIEVLRGGKAVPFGRFSQGEKGRMIIANILALQKLINLSSKSGGLDLLVIDELFNSLDSEGIFLVMKSLQKINQTIELITHSQHNIKDVDIVTWVKKNNKSNYFSGFYSLEILKEEATFAENG